MRVLLQIKLASGVLDWLSEYYKKTFLLICIEPMPIMQIRYLPNKTKICRILYLQIAFGNIIEFNGYKWNYTLAEANGKGHAILKLQQIEQLKTGRQESRTTTLYTDSGFKMMELPVT